MTKTIDVTTTSLIDQTTVLFKQQPSQYNNIRINTDTNNTNKQQQQHIKLLSDNTLIDSQSVRRLHKQYQKLAKSKPTRTQVPYACLYIDSQWNDLLYAYTCGTCYMLTNIVNSTSTQQFQRQKLIQSIIHYIDRQHTLCRHKQTTTQYTKLNHTINTDPQRPMHLIPTLSCRSALDLFLTAKQYKPKSIILMSAINIPDVSTVIRAHNLIPVPIDIESIHTLTPSIELLHSAIIRSGGSVCALLCAHIFGKQCDMSKYIALCKLYNIDFIEDAAEIFSGYEYFGHPESTVSFYSFGSIKTNTAFGGAIMRIRDLNTYMKIHAIHDTWSVQSNTTFLTKCMKNTATMSLLNIPVVSGTTMSLCYNLNIDHKKYVVNMIRGFPGDEMLQGIRQQPCIALLQMLHHRLTTFNSVVYKQGNIKADFLIELLSYNNLSYTPGLNVVQHNHWLFPVAVPQPQHTIEQLNAYGIDAYSGATQLTTVVQPNELDEQLTVEPTIAKEFMTHVIYLPVHKNVPVQQLIRIAHVFNHVVTELQKQPNIASKL